MSQHATFEQPPNTINHLQVALKLQCTYGEHEYRNTPSARANTGYRHSEVRGVVRDLTALVTGKW